MKKLLLILSVSISLNAQVKFDFETAGTSAWVQYPEGRWDTSSNQPLGGAYSLKHVFDNEASSADRISYHFNKPLNMKNDSASWKFKVQHSYLPSSGNNWAVFLAADSNASQMCPKCDINGYVAGVNFSCSDDMLKLWKVTKGVASEIINSGYNWEEQTGTSSHAAVFISKSPEGLWQLKIDSSGTGTDYINYGNATDTDFSSGTNFGVYYKYSSSQDMKLRIDDISVTGRFEADTSTEKPDSYIAQKYDVIINELMPDPAPAIGLPQYEYVELYNKTNSAINLAGWTITAGRTTKTFPDIVIDSGSYLILCHAECINEFEPFGETLGIFSSQSMLSNSGTTVILKDNTGTEISTAEYTPDLFPSEKKDGGWSLELRNPDDTCMFSSKFGASTNMSGGTPGARNSIYGTAGDTYSPEVISLWPESSSTVYVSFSEPIDSVFLYDTSLFFVDNSIGHPVSVIINKENFSEIVLLFQSIFNKKTLYNISFSDRITDCYGNKLSSNGHDEFAVCENADSLDIIVNEFLFNPLSGGAQFIELFNRSNKYINMKGLKLIVWNLETNNFSSVTEICNDDLLVSPGQYIVLSSDINKVSSFYSCNNDAALIDVKSMPLLDKNNGKIILADEYLEPLDEMSYSESMHSPLLDNTRGVSLERISAGGSSQNVSNWTSAGEGSGFATPGSENSQNMNVPTLSHNNIRLEPEVFSPDNDGTDDKVFLYYSLDEPGSVAQVTVFDITGRTVKHILRNEYLEPEGFTSWDGTDDYGKHVVAGIYIIHIQIHDRYGKTKVFNKTCVAANR